MSHLHFRNKKVARKHIHKISSIILAVIDGLKPAYLWDEFLSDVDEIEKYVEDLTSSRNAPLKVLRIGDDIFIVNLSVLRTHLNDIGKRVELVDVSKTNRHPLTIRGKSKDLILQNVVNCFQRYVEYTDNAPWREENVRCNMTTLYGSLLGYPVLYWYDDNSADTCLSMLPLNVYQVTAKQRNANVGKSHVLLYSFSVPEMLSNAHHTHLKTWFSDIERRDFSNFSDIEFVTHHVTLPAVAL